MERDYFLDRPIDVTMPGKIKVGTEVYICLKAMQPYAKELDDLSRGIVTEVLTKHEHSAGLKVRITQSNGLSFVGRVTYIVKNGKIMTKNGLKDEKDVNK